MRHGGDLSEATRRFGGNRNDWVDLSTGINPHAWTNHIKLSAEAWRRLPDDDAMASLLAAARTAYHVPTALAMTAAPGTESILARLPSIAPAGDVAILAPTYSSHANGWRAGLTGIPRQVREVADLSELALSDRIVVLVNPNNPDGRVVAPEALLELARQLGERGGLLIVDEAFADVSPDISVLPYLGGEPVAVLRSFGKFFGLAGLRLGFLSGPPEICDSLSLALGGWAVSGPALEIGAAALGDAAWQTDMRERLAGECAALDAVLSARGLEIAGGTSLYRLIRHRQAHALHAALARRHIWTRCFDYSTDWLRIGLPATQADLSHLDEALAQAVCALAEET